MRVRGLWAGEPTVFSGRMQIILPVLYRLGNSHGKSVIDAAVVLRILSIFSCKSLDFYRERARGKNYILHNAEIALTCAQRLLNKR